MWVKTIEGNTINMDHVVNVTIKRGYEHNDYDYFVYGYLPWAKGDGMCYVLFRGTEEECLDAKDEIDEGLDLQLSMVSVTTLPSTPKSMGQNVPDEELPF